MEKQKDKHTQTLGERLKELRIKKNFSGKELAKRANINYATYMAYETRNRQPSAKNLTKIANALNVPIDFLVLNQQDTLGNGYKLIPVLNDSYKDSLLLESAIKNHISNKNIDIDKDNAVHPLAKNISYNNVDYDIVPEIERLKAKLLSSKATFGLNPIDAKTRKEFFMRFNQIVNDLLYQDYFSDDETADTGNDESEQSAPSADSDEHKEHKEHKKSVD